MLKNKNRINRFSAAAEAAKNGRSVFLDNGKNYNLQEHYPCRLNFYLRPPPSEITIEEFEQFALDRLQVLRTIENASLRNRPLKDELTKILGELLPLHSNQSKSDKLYEERRKDHISHYVLRMAYCRSEELRNWFVKQETVLFKFRFEQETLEEKKRFLTLLSLGWKVLTSEEKENIREQLELCSKAPDSMNVQEYVSREEFFEVDFEKVPGLIGSRSVYLKGGKAYVPMSKQVDLVMLEFKNYLTKSLESIYKLLPRMEEDDRLKPILLNVENQYTGKSYNDDDNALVGTISCKDVGSAVRQHAPLCMRVVQDVLIRDKHLKHSGRLQYGLFLKGIGLSIEEALLFWRTSFSNISDDKFQKEYSYNVRYNYGLEGKRANYKPYSCMKIIKGDGVSSGEYHGCPFKTFSAPNLETRLKSDHITGNTVDEIVELARQKHYQLACTRYFEAKHPQMKEKAETIEHPNQYYEMSKRLAEEQEENRAPEAIVGEAMEFDD